MLLLFFRIGSFIFIFFYEFEAEGITPDELKSAMKTLGFDSNNNEVSKILDKIDNKKGPLKFDDFMDDDF